MGGHIGLDEGVAIWLSSRGCLASNGPAAARNIFNDDGLAQRFGQSLASGATNHVGTATRGHRDDVTNRLDGVRRLGHAQGAQAHQGCRG